MTGRPAIVVTTINPPTAAMTVIAAGARAAGFALVVAGDRRTPVDFTLDGARFLPLADQDALGFAYAAACPIGHYARKNIGYLAAIRDGATLIIDTDDDNIPEAGFFARPERRCSTPALDGAGWVNIYRYFGADGTWPRGLALDAVQAPLPDYAQLPETTADCPVQQGLADDNPDVDAIYRLTRPLPVRFRRDRSIALGRGSWCPFNSQNTRWWPEVFPLLYLPALCSFRMTDIWRSLVAQRIAWANGWRILFHAPTVRQERNAHDLMKDFADEVPGYLHNARIAAALDALAIEPGADAIPAAMRRCYRAMVDLGVLPEAELALLDRWLDAF